MASHLGIPVQELQHRVTSSEFQEWMLYLEEDVNKFHREDYYMAQQALITAKGLVKNPKKLKLEDFLLKFKDSTPEEPEDKMKSSKSFWFGSLGMEGKE